MKLNIIIYKKNILRSDLNEHVRMESNGYQHIHVGYGFVRRNEEG